MIAVVLVFALPAVLALGMLSVIGLVVAGASVAESGQLFIRS